jgi:ubiquinone/menaquinone biosynthesis C-methylase UbiE
MPVQPDFVERAAFRLNLAPGVLLDFLGAQAFRTVCVAVELGVFEALASGPRSVSEMAERVSASERGVGLLLDALEALGYVQSRGGRFAATPTTRKWLMQGFARGIPFFESMVFDRWGHLAESIRRGAPVASGFQWLEGHPERWAAYEEAMLVIARTAAPEIVSKTKPSRAARRLLDVGGGHGLYAIEFCRTCTGLSAEIFDLPSALEIARRTIATENMAGRVSVIEGDLRSDDFGSDYDVVLLFNVLHCFCAEENADLLQRISRAMTLGGTVAVLEQTADRTEGAAGYALTRLQALNFFNDLGTRTYASEEIRTWLAAAGFSGCKRRTLRRLPGFTLLTATKRNGEHA